MSPEIPACPGFEYRHADGDLWNAFVFLSPPSAGLRPFGEFVRPGGNEENPTGMANLYHQKWGVKKDDNG